MRPELEAHGARLLLAAVPMLDEAARVGEAAWYGSVRGKGIVVAAVGEEALALADWLQGRGAFHAEAPQPVVFDHRIKTVPHASRFEVREGPHVIWQPPGAEGTDGVHGYAIQDDGPGALWLPVLIGMPQNHGHLGAMLREAPRDRTVVVPTVVSRQLKDMLHRRGFLDAMVLPPRMPAPPREGTWATRQGPWNLANARAVVARGVPAHPLEHLDGWWPQ